ncbi:lymphocyte function-associated antigen 3-like [Poeciliopsis prolifica]|uniref:lymphocyte function-associated antigen 3-like n=1 Tax=Poeciliopsis prolifica TaxID=188132 RepID=UPI0024141FCC|nr:lymphocyte function-associated antigen 3-like [Poeciliopsis prolifica]XP_054879230.1 lymphocyte function-associated antigen 3-like [Poeciliopsis prolifica]
MSAFWTVSAVLLLYFMQDSDCSRLIYAKIGDSVILHPSQTFESMSTITWMHNMNAIMQWRSGGDAVCLGDFIGRCRLDKPTGSLLIKHLTVEDTGKYNPEIDNKILDVTELWVIKPVPKPTVSAECNNGMSVCDLTCEANITSHFGPVMYRWEAGDKLLSTNMKISLTRNNMERSFVCKLQNHVSNSSSDEVPNPIVPQGIHPAGVAVPIVVLVLFLVAVGSYMRQRNDEKQVQTVEEVHVKRSALSLKALRNNGVSLESFESGPSPSPVRKFSSAREIYLQDDEERWVQNHPEYRNLTPELREFRLHRDL